MLMNVSITRYAFEMVAFFTFRDVTEAGSGWCKSKHTNSILFKTGNIFKSKPITKLKRVFKIVYKLTLPYCIQRW